jgi:predicted nucleic acid-binding protein
VGRGPKHIGETSLVSVVSDASPLITLAKIKELDLLPKLYRAITITPQVYDEVVVTGASLSGAAEVLAARWIQIKPVANFAQFDLTREQFALGKGETSAIILAIEIGADLLLVDELKARKTAQAHGLTVLGCVGILEDAFAKGLVIDLASGYRRLIASGAYIDPEILNRSLRSLGLGNL